MPRLKIWCWLLLLGIPCTGLAQEASLRTKLQRAVEQSMAARAGTAVVLDVKSGRILAQYRLETAARRLVHPGSTVKPFTLLALLESTRLDPAAAVACPGELRLGARRMNCSHDRTGEALTAVTALAYSCNYYFAQAAQHLEAHQMSTALARAGLASATGLARQEAVGIIRTAENPEQLQLQALGEANIEVTPLELLAAYRNLALLRRETATPSPALAIVFEGLQGSAAYGMARAAQPKGLEIAGKTGTATASEGRWTHAWFAGYAPARAPEIVLVVFLERGRGSTDAAGIARAIFTAYASAAGPARGTAAQGHRPATPSKAPRASAAAAGGP